MVERGAVGLSSAAILRTRSRDPLDLSMSPWTHYWLSVLLLASLLFWPASKLVWVLSVRRLERKSGRTLAAEERAGQLVRARLLAAILGLAFSLLFNYKLLDMSAYGMGHG
jgi:hypothetical protein